MQRARFVLIFAAAVLMSCAFACGRAAASTSADAACPSWTAPSTTPPAATTPGTTTTTTTTPATTTAAAFAPAGSQAEISDVASSTMVGAKSAVLAASLEDGTGDAVTLQYWPASSTSASASCTRVQHPTSSSVSVALSGLQPSLRYRFRFFADDASGVASSNAGTFVTLPTDTIAEGVTIDGTSLARLGKTGAVAKLNHLVGAPLRLTYAGAFWNVLPTKVGAHFDITKAVDAALAATPGEQLPKLSTSVDGAAVRAYVNSLARRWRRAPTEGSVELVGKHAVVTPKRAGVTVDTAHMAAAIENELTTGKRTLLTLAVNAVPVTKAPVEKAVVVRLSTQTLTAYLNGKAILTTPVTTGRPALPTPIGSYKILNRESPYVFHSPWPQGSPYWYPPTPVTWAMEFYDGDFLHDDPGEPADAFGSDSDEGYFASHGCVHVPHDTMAYLYNWLPIGAPVIVAES